ncbi:hypothetical protein QR680_013593 [Steinernema hermaphroditum]|uniref:Peptidase S1 domain-containing protein n=1 Tax=Steinernema hermaphroditum TaxID=289476 RepID=A0AA39I7M6_9BILA|nr:hypothetical protein QR680_013593 [Steinernema hermaphroditum]
MFPFFFIILVLSVTASHDMGNAPLTRFIFGGTHAYTGQWPSQVLFYTKKASTGKTYMCGGTLLTSNHVLTAAHCTDDLASPSLVVTGATSTSGLSKNPKVQIREVTSFFRHPHYDPNDTYVHDIAVLTLSKPVSINKNTQIARILADDSRLLEVGHGVVSGFGAHKVEKNRSLNNGLLSWVDVPFKEHTSCTSEWESSSGGKVHIKPNHICYGAEGKGTGTGDSGGPIQVKAGRAWYQIGVISFGVGVVQRMTQQDKYPSVGTRIAPYCGFLERVTKNVFKCLQNT